MNARRLTGEPLPAKLGPADMMREFEIGRSQFYELLKAGRFDRFEVRPQIGPRRWSGVKVQRHFDGESMPFIGVMKKKPAA